MTHWHDSFWLANYWTGGYWLGDDVLLTILIEALAVVANIIEESDIFGGRR